MATTLPGMVPIQQMYYTLVPAAATPGHAAKLGQRFRRHSANVCFEPALAYGIRRDDDGDAWLDVEGMTAHPAHWNRGRPQ